MEEFWQPLVSHLDTLYPYRLIILMSMTGTVRPEWTPLLQPPPDELTVHFDLALPIQLTGLSTFTEGELATWLQKRLPPNQAQALAKVLIEETQGQPQILYNILQDDRMWRS